MTATTDPSLPRILSVLFEHMLPNFMEIALLINLRKKLTISKADQNGLVSEKTDKTMANKRKTKILQETVQRKLKLDLHEPYKNKMNSFPKG